VSDTTIRLKAHPNIVTHNALNTREINGEVPKPGQLKADLKKNEKSKQNRGTADIVNPALCGNWTRCDI
jgi:hypothetical protein